MARVFVQRAPPVRDPHGPARPGVFLPLAPRPHHPLMGGTRHHVPGVPKPVPGAPGEHVHRTSPPFLTHVMPSILWRCAPSHFPIRGIHLSRDNLVSVMYAEELSSNQSSATLQRTDRHGILGQK